jgi:hypothetical protein
MSIGKAAPWLLSVLIAIGASLLFLSGKQKDETIASQNAQIRKLTDDYNKLASDANAKVESLVKEANEKLALANLPLVPVKFSTVKPLFEDGLAVQVRNTSDKTIAITMTVERPSAGKSKVYELTIDGGLGKNIGKSDGWAFISGDTVVIAQPEHKSLSYTIQQ